MKKIVGLMLIFLMMVNMFGTVKAATFTYTDENGNKFTYSVYNSKVYIESFSGSGEAILPAKIKGYPVVKIEKEAFFNAPITSITIPSTIETIGTKAFWYCNSLENVYIEDIESWCYITFDDYLSQPMTYAKNLFVKGKLLSELEIPETITQIQKYSFKGCESLTDVVLPKTVTTIGVSAFEDCRNLKSINIPNSVSSIGRCAFLCCSSLERIEIPNSIIEIKGQTFEGCTSLKEVKLHENLKTIGSGGFRRCAFSSIDIPNSVTDIGYYCFMECELLSEIKLPNSITSVGPNAFSDCNSLTEFTVPDSITYIPNLLFSNSKNLKSIKIPKTVKKINYASINGCTNLTDIYYEGDEQDWGNIEIEVTNGYNPDGTFNRVNIHYNSFISEGNTPDSGVVDKEFLSTASFEKWHAYFLTDTNNAISLAVGVPANVAPYSYWVTAENEEYAYRRLYNAYKDETLFNIGTCLYGVIDGKDIAFGLSEYYDLILASIIKESYMTDFSLEDTKSSILNNFEKVAEAILFEIGGAAGKDVYTKNFWDVDNSDIEDAFALLFPEGTEYKKIVEASKLGLKGTESLGQVIERGVVLGQLARNNKATAEVLTDMKNVTDDLVLKEALVSVIASYTDYSDPINIAKTFTAKGFEICLETFEQAFEIAMDKVISSALIKAGLEAVSSTVGATLSIGTAVSDLIFSTGKKCELYFTLKSVNKIEDSIKSLMRTYGSMDMSAITNEESEKIIELYRLLHTNALFGLNASKRFVDITYGDETLAFKIYRSDDTKAMYEDYSTVAESQVVRILERYGEKMATSKRCFELLKNGNSDGMESINPVIENVVERITITPPQKLEYISGESLDTTGMVITAHLTDGTTKNVTSGYLIYGFDTDVLGQQEITIEYENVTATFTIVIEDANTISHIEVLPNRTPLTYYKNEKFDPKDVYVIAYYTDGTSCNVKEYTLINYTSEVVGKRMSTIRYCGKTVDFEIEILEPQLTELQVLVPDKKVYYVNDKIDLTGLNVIAVYNTGTHMLLNRGQYKCSHDVITNSGVNTIVISYGNKQSEFSVIAYSDETILGVFDIPQYCDGKEVTTDTIYNYDKLYTTVYNASGQKTNLYIIVAFYHKNKLINTSITKTIFDVESKTFELDIPDNMSNVTDIKLFYWDYNTIAPLASTIEI